MKTFKELQARYTDLTRQIINIRSTIEDLKSADRDYSYESIEILNKVVSDIENEMREIAQHEVVQTRINNAK